MKNFKLIKPNFGALYSNRNDCPFIQETWDREGNDITIPISSGMRFNKSGIYFVTEDNDLPF